MMARLIVTALFLACVLTSTTFAASIKGTVEATGSGSITVKDDSESSQKIAVDSGAKITLDGKKCKLDDLQAGTSVEVETEIKGDKTVAVTITARSPE
jgi:hypothetical protein